MKSVLKILLTTSLSLVLVFTSINLVKAQYEFDVFDWGNTNTYDTCTGPNCGGYTYDPCDLGDCSNYYPTYTDPGTPTWSQPYVAPVSPSWVDDYLYNQPSGYTNVWSNPAPTYSAPRYNPTYVAPTYTYSQPTYVAPTYTYTQPPRYNTPNYNVTYTYGTGVTYTNPTPIIRNPTVTPTPTCTNGALNYPSCNVCPVSLIYRNGSCVAPVTCPANYVANNNNQCEPGQKRCADGTAVLFYEQCYKTCPNGVRVIETQTCPTTNTSCPQYYTWNGTSCVAQTKECPNGNPRTVNIWETCTKLCTTGSLAGQYIPENQACPVTNCPTNYTLSGNTCIPITKQCPNGVTVNVWEVCPTQNQTCWDGSVIPVTQVCPSQFKICPNGQSVPVNQTCFRICSNGQSVPEGQTCYRTCPNGQSVPETQSCPFIDSYPTVDININPGTITRGESGTLTWTSQNASYCTASNGWTGNVSLSGSSIRNNIFDTTTYTITCYNSQGRSATDSTTIFVRQNNPISHRVVTTVPTQITKTSARCNGVGIISNGVMSTGWFEYGETSNLGSLTNSASIGNSPSAPFSNMITGLKPNTTYYCRAVMANANGTYKGEIMSFKTLGDVINYVPVTPVKPSKPKTPAKPIICQDETGAKESLEEGEKLMTISIDRKSGNTIVGQEVEYRVKYMNTSKINLSNGIVKVVLPKEFSYVSSNSGTFDQSNNTLIANVGQVGAGESGEVIVKVKIKDTAQIGSSAIVSSYISYDALDKDGKTLRDENTAFVVSTIGKPENSGAATNTNVKGENVKSEKRSTVLPDTILEWLAVIALILVLIVLGRAIYKGIKGEEHAGSH